MDPRQSTVPTPDPDRCRGPEVGGLERTREVRPTGSHGGSPFGVRHPSGLHSDTPCRQEVRPRRTSPEDDTPLDSGTHLGVLGRLFGSRPGVPSSPPAISNDEEQSDESSRDQRWRHFIPPWSVETPTLSVRDPSVSRYVHRGRVTDGIRDEH